MLNHLPVKKDIMVKSRFIVRFFYSFPFQFILLVCLYPLTPDLRDVLSIGSYIAFSIIWLSFSFYAGYLFPASESGTNTNMNPALAIILFFAVIIGAMFIFSIIHIVSGHGLQFIHFSPSRIAFSLLLKDLTPQLFS